MFELRKLALVVVALAAVAAVTSAEDDKDKVKPKSKKEKLIAREGAVEIGLLRHKSVQEELKLTDEQVTKTKAFTAKQWKKAQEVHEMDKDKQEPEWTAMTKANDEFLHKELSADQRTRLGQIGMQVAGLLWVTRPDIAKKLELTAEQKKTIHGLQHTAHEEMHDAIHGTGSAEEKATKISELSKANGKGLRDVLTDEQKATWKKLAGERFKGDLSKE